MSNQSAKFSVITVSYNHADYIRQTIESVLLQKYTNFEHIVIDGGSTDETIDILKAYPHLQWISEPDRGQSHALNKGFRKATGDIIAWLNSDDWYAPGIFNDVALALEDYPIVMGGCELTDRYGVSIETVPNVERNWFDVLKYWIFYSSPSQPSIFFRKHLLDEFKIQEGVYLDENLDFCMDYDLWLRIGQKYPLNRRIRRVFSFYRTYDSNKTGKHMDAVYREMSRVYKRHMYKLTQAERKFSVVIPISESSRLLPNTLASLEAQSFRDLEVVIVNFGSDKKASRAIREEIICSGKQYDTIGLRYVCTEDESYFQALNHGFKVAQAPWVINFKPGDTLDNDFFFRLNQIIANDSLGALLITPRGSELVSLFCEHKDEKKKFRLDSVFLSPFMSQPCVFSKVALMELGGFRSQEEGFVSELSAFRQILLRLVYKGWQIAVEDGLGISILNEETQEQKSLIEVFHLYINAHIVVEHEAEFKTDPFAGVRVQNGFCYVLSDQIIDSAKWILGITPPRWYAMPLIQDRLELERITREYPDFSPGWFLLREWYKKAKEEGQAKSADLNFQKAKAKEANL